MDKKWLVPAITGVGGFILGTVVGGKWFGPFFNKKKKKKDDEDEDDSSDED